MENRSPVRFKRVAAAFDEEARARICESSGSEYSATDDHSSPDLSDLVDSFLERENNDDEEKEVEEQNESAKKEFDSKKYSSDSERKDMLESLLRFDGLEEVDSDTKKKILNETELACRFMGTSSSSEGFKRNLMIRLRERGFDAGLCKSRWEKNGRFPGGTFEYVDVIITGIRYIIGVYLAGEFTIARPTTHYLSLLQVFPDIFVATPDKLKQVLRLMCAAGKKSLKSNDMLVPPWRSNGYMQAKWLGSYKRTTNSSVTAKIVSGSGEKRLVVGFESSSPVNKYYYCRSGGLFERREEVMVGMRVGKLAEMMNGI